MAKSNPICQNPEPRRKQQKCCRAASPAFSLLLCHTLLSLLINSPSPFRFQSNTTGGGGSSPRKQQQLVVLCASSYEVGGGYSDKESSVQEENKGRRTQQEWDEKPDPFQHEVIIKGGEQVISVLQEMITLLEDLNMDDASEKVAVELVAHGVIGKRVDEMEAGFMMALDYMIQLAEKDQDGMRKSLLEVIKETVLSHLTKKCPPHVQVIGLLCRTPRKESRHELLRRVAAGGGVFEGDKGTKVHIPGANLNEIANQADDILETMETRPVVPDRKLLARLVLIREEARDMMGGGILDERNDRGFKTLPESEVNFIAKLVALKPGKTVQEMIKNVMLGKDEGAEDAASEEENIDSERISSGIAGRGSITGRKPLPVRPGMFLETVTKVLGGVYSGNISGITGQHLEWVHRKTLQILQEIAY
ncbi:PROTEIN PEP-RELATED DEVELOPMENT ARRESTED 1 CHLOROPLASTIC [Salix viminalis]|uniref:PROTEIN PEP-RELATED DEVELOPMENT ARRESTED 1 CHLOROPLASTIC n=1 Tax=Salix viminalis TaxID=40686 RepID=A0A9Q0UFF6_SALVM|nr:PROTEIN PEP-RELATED DEVELOPMENT ARRESTED 1 CHLOROPLASTIC [Salix viminalis]